MEAGKPADGMSYAWWMAAIFGIGGVGLLGMLVLAGPDDIAALGFFTFCIVLLFVGFGGLLYSIYSSGLEDAAPADAPYACKHCGRRFTKKKSHEVHERTCVEMRI